MMAVDSQPTDAVMGEQQSAGRNPMDCGSMGEQPRWFAVAAKHRQAEAAALAIQALGFGTFLPMIRAPMPNGGYEHRPLCAPYLFAEFSLSHPAWPKILRLQPVRDGGILRSIGSANPMPVPTRMLDALRASIRDRWIADPVATLVAIGAAVRLVSGPGEGMRGSVAALRRGAREARVECDGCVLPLWVPVDRLQLLTGE